MIQGNINKIPHFLTAKSPEKLQISMLKNNVENHTEYRYFDISEAKGQWYAWFVKDITPSIKKQLNKG